MTNSINRHIEPDQVYNPLGHKIEGNGVISRSQNLTPFPDREHVTSTLLELVALSKLTIFLKVVTLLVQAIAACKTNFVLGNGHIWGSVNINKTEQRVHCLRTNDVTSADDETFAI